MNDFQSASYEYEHHSKSHLHGVQKDYSKSKSIQYPTVQYPTQSQRVHYHGPICCIGHPSLKIYKFRLPPHLRNLLDHIVNGCDEYAATLPGGWSTYLYSLTKQDIALRDVPGMYRVATPIVSYIKDTMERMYGATDVKIDRNQPHVLRYCADEGDSNHTGVELHHDKCSLTANIMMSRSHSYVGGGTYFPVAKATVRLEFGEFLIHPGKLVHAGVDITQGVRTLMILFTHVDERAESRETESTTL